MKCSRFNIILQKTAADFAKQLNQLKTQNDQNNRAASNLIAQNKGVYQLPAEDEQDEEYDDDDFEKDFQKA